MLGAGKLIRLAHIAPNTSAQHLTNFIETTPADVSGRYKLQEGQSWQYSYQWQTWENSS